jgi:hypothetical protein
MIHLDEIKNTVNQAYSERKCLRIEGYTSTDGNISDMVVEFLGPDGYNGVLEKSLKLIQDGEISLENPDGVLVGAQAAAALAVSWAKSLSGLQKERQFKDTLNYEELVKQGYTVNESGCVVIKHVSVVQSSNVHSVARKESATPLVRAKKIITDQTPMGKYRGQLNLSPDKISGLSVV